MKALQTQLEEQTRQLCDAIKSCETAITSNDASVVPDTTLRINPDFRNSKEVNLRLMNDTNGEHVSNFLEFGYLFVTTSRILMNYFVQINTLSLDATFQSFQQIKTGSCNLQSLNPFFLPNNLLCFDDVSPQFWLSTVSFFWFVCTSSNNIQVWFDL